MAQNFLPTPRPGPNFFSPGGPGRKGAGPGRGRGQSRAQTVPRRSLLPEHFLAEIFLCRAETVKIQSNFDLLMPWRWLPFWLGFWPPCEACRWLGRPRGHPKNDFRLYLLVKTITSECQGQKHNMKCPLLLPNV